MSVCGQLKHTAEISSVVRALQVLVIFASLVGLTIIYIGHCGMDTGPLGLSCGIWHLQIESGSLQILWVAERESVDTVRSSAFHGCSIGCGSRLFWSSGPCTGLFALFLKLFLSSFCYLAGTSSCWETPLLLVISVGLQHLSWWIRSN